MPWHAKHGKPANMFIAVGHGCGVCCGHSGAKPTSQAVHACAIRPRTESYDRGNQKWVPNGRYAADAIRPRKDASHKWAANSPLLREGCLVQEAACLLPAAYDVVQPRTVRKRRVRKRNPSPQGTHPTMWRVGPTKRATRTGNRERSARPRSSTQPEAQVGSNGASERGLRPRTEHMPAASDLVTSKRMSARHKHSGNGPLDAGLSATACAHPPNMAIGRPV